MNWLDAFIVIVGIGWCGMRYRRGFVARRGGVYRRGPRFVGRDPFFGYRGACDGRRVGRPAR